MSVVHPAIVETPKAVSTAHWAWADEMATQTFANALAQRPELQNAYLELVGNLGAGKTTFVRHLLKALGVQGRIKSPTYAVVEPHEGRHPATAQALAIWHFDFYRFNDPQEFEEAGFRDLFASSGLKIAEWPEQAKGMLPPADLMLTLTVHDLDARNVKVEAHTPQGLQLLQALRNVIPPLPASLHANSTT